MTKSGLLKKNDVFKAISLESILLDNLNKEYVASNITPDGYPYHSIKYRNEVEIPINHEKIDKVTLLADSRIQIVFETDIKDMYGLEPDRKYMDNVYKRVFVCSCDCGGVRVGKRIVNFDSIDKQWLEEIFSKVLK